MITKEQFDRIDYCLSVIYDLGYDYDGFETPESLKSLIDEIVAYATRARIILHGKEDQLCQ